ncbi:hypothetical protein AXG93_2646s1090 [Marchantia polymorpha subsp. ruderalis]|uniref:Ricin B lectin domain-containing protein n=2 Tax=Marchantia polymorpha TaxID=3197 RepID=A0A176W4Q4_MARPO|nr:hypothetical protein AXG93_2646s1090 [Marchantia polymorpha subsp. ruderalis]
MAKMLIFSFVAFQQETMSTSMITQGIPFPASSATFTVANAETGAHLVVEDRSGAPGEYSVTVSTTETHAENLNFNLVASTYPDQPLNTCYHIQTVYAKTASAIADDGDESDDEDVGPDTGPVISKLDQADKKQLWFIEPSTEFGDGCFRFRNANTNGYLYQDQNYGLQSKPATQEERRQDWVLQFDPSAGSNVPVGIPLIHTQFRISNLAYKKVIHAKLSGDKGIIGLQNEVTLRKDQVFTLVPSTRQPGVYHMRSVYTDFYVSQSTTGNLSLVPLSHGDMKQAWSLVPTTIKPGFYRLQNVASAEFVMVTLDRTHYVLGTDAKPEREYQCWNFLGA